MTAERASSSDAHARPFGHRFADRVGLATLAASFVGATSMVAVALATPAPALAAVNPIVTENLQQGSAGWIIGQLVSDDVNGQIKGYASTTSVAQGGSITLYVTVNPAGPYTIDVYRIGWYGGLGGRLRQHLALDGAPQAPCTAADPNIGMIACSWTPSATLAIPTDWTTGIYLALMTNAQGYQNYIGFVVRDGRSAPFVLQESVNTYQAYNNYPNDNATGKSLYTYNSYGPNTLTGNARAVKVSFDRPYTAEGDGIGLHEFPFIRWLERSGYDATYTTDIDTHASGGALRNSKGFIALGHDEYWSKEMFDAVLAARDAGTNLAFLEANTAYWQVRYEPSAAGVANRVMVCYKFAAFDPVQGPTTTVNFRDPPVSRPEQLVEGVQFTGETASFNDRVGYVVTNSSHWAYAGTGLKDGDVVPGIVGNEMDRYMADVPGPSSVRTQTLLSRSPYTDITGRADYANSSLYQASSGALVFASGTISWDFALDGFYYPQLVDARIQQTMANILNAFLSGPPVAALRATAPATAIAGQPFTVSVSATDAQGTPVAEYMGSVHFAASDTSAGVVLPADSTLSSGQGTFAVTLTQAGSQTVTISDGAKSLSTTVAITVNAQPATRLAVTATGTPSAGGAFNFGVAAQDRFGNTDPTYAGRIHFSTSDSSSGVVLPADATLTSGQGAFSATLIRSGAQTISATDTTTSSINGTLSVTVMAGPATSLQLTVPPTATAGQAFRVTVTAIDRYGNGNAQYGGTVHFTTSDTAPGVVLPVDSTLNNGQGTFSVKLIRAGSQTVAIADAANSFAASASLVVNAAPASRFALASANTTPTAGAAVSFTVTAQDPYANTDTAYAGRIHFSSSDTSAGVVLPSDASLTSGQGTFSATLTRAGSQTVTARDTVSSSISGTLSVTVRAGPAASLSIAAPASATATQAFNVSVTLKDRFGNVATGYTGTVTFTSSDLLASLPSAYGFTAADAGTRTFSVTLTTPPSQTITVADNANASLTATTAPITVGLPLPSLP